MRGFIQVGCVVAVACGAGLFAFAWFMQPQHDSNSLAKLAPYLDPHQYERDRVALSTYTALGIGFMTLGGIGLVVSWVNLLLVRQRLRDLARSPKTSSAV